MRRKLLSLVFMALVLLTTLLTGCRKSVVPPVDTLVPEDEATAVMQEAEGGTEGMQPLPQATTASPMMTPTEESAPVEPIIPTTEPTATTEVVAPPSADTPVPTVAVATAVPGQPATHVVQAGENLFRIALRYNTTVAEIAQLNNITNPGMISVGQVLTIPSGSGGTTPPPSSGQTCATTYTVMPGDNLFRIALRYNYSQYYLAQVNGITNPALIKVGQVICIP